MLSRACRGRRRSPFDGAVHLRRSSLTNDRHVPKRGRGIGHLTRSTTATSAVQRPASGPSGILPDAPDHRRPHTHVRQLAESHRIPPRRDAPVHPQRFRRSHACNRRCRISRYLTWRDRRAGSMLLQAIATIASALVLRRKNERPPAIHEFVVVVRRLAHRAVRTRQLLI